LQKKRRKVWFCMDGILLMLFAILSEVSISNFLSIFGFCFIVGSIIDFSGLSAKLWDYPRVEKNITWSLFLGPLGYAFIGTAITLTFLFLVTTIFPLEYLPSFILVILVYSVLHEGLNYLWGSWVYSKSLVLVFVGWIPLVVVFLLSLPLFRILP